MFPSLKPLPTTATLFLYLIAPSLLFPHLVTAVAQPSGTEQNKNASEPFLEVQGILEPGDSTLSDDNSLYDEYSFVGKQGQRIVILLESLEFDTYLMLFDPQGVKIGENDDISEENTNSIITITVPKNGTYELLVNAYDAQTQGQYTLKVMPVLPGQEQELPTFSSVAFWQAEANHLNQQGFQQINTSQFQVAHQLFEQALAIYRGISDRAGEGKTLIGLGTVHYHLGQSPKAIEYYQQALLILQMVGDRAGEGTTLHNLGTVHYHLGQYPKAIEYYQQALPILQMVGDRAGEGTTLHNLGVLHYHLGEYAQAEINLYAAITVWEFLRSPKFTDADKIALFETQAHTYESLQLTLIAQNKTDRALEISERGRARAFVELLAKQLNPLSNEPPKIDPPSVEEIKQIAKDQNATLIQYSVLSNSLLIWVIQPTGKIDFRAVDLKKLDGSLADVTEIARLQAAGERGADNPDEFTSLIRGTQESLRSTLAVLPKDGIDNRINRLQQLHQILIAPIADLLPTNPEDRVIFIPHQELFYVPFPALTDTNDNYLIEKHTILTAPSIHVLQLTREHRQRIPGTFHETSLQSDRALIVGNPSMPWIPDGNGGSFQLSNLSGAEREATEIAQMLNTEALLGENATETTVSRRMKTARLIHFATHGLLGNFGYGIPGAIALAPTGDGETGGRGDGVIGEDINDGLLTSGEIITMTQNNPLNAELVVLSACETGLGDLSGDGIIGLSRSLITAGVPSIMVSLWKVPDAATRELMTEFYTNRYEKKMDKAQALRQAMLTMLEGNYPDPTAWAAFTLMGEAE